MENLINQQPTTISRSFHKFKLFSDMTKLNTINILPQIPITTKAQHNFVYAQTFLLYTKTKTKSFQY